MGKILFDSHAHINEESYTDAERAELIQNIESSELAYVIDIGYDIKSSELAIKHAQTYEWCFAAVGIHPLHLGVIKGDTPQGRRNVPNVLIKELTGLAKDNRGHSPQGCVPLCTQLRELAKQNCVKAIGEIGLDYRDPDVDKALQQEVFREQIHLAKELDLPIVIHQVSAYEDTLKILKEEKAFDGAGVMLHCFSGSAEQAKECVRLGAMISIGGHVTWTGNRRASEPAKIVPIEDLLIETDSPFLAPEPLCNQMNSPVLLEYIAKKVAELRGISYEELAKATFDNGARFYGIR